MRKLAKIFSLSVLMGLLTVAAPVHAALQAVGPASTPLSVTGGAPTWYQDVAGVAAAPCLDNLGFCGLVPDLGFNGTLPEVFPGNINEEWFYWSATALFTVNGANALALQALEATYLDPITNIIVLPSAVGAKPVTFQRLRVKMLNTPVAGTYTILHPFGQTTFDCPTAGVVCTFTRDLGGAIAGDFVGALGVGVADSVSNILVQATPPPAGYFGDGVTVGPITGGTVRQRYDIIDPNGINVGGTNLITITGKKFGMEVAPNPVDFTAVVIPNSSVAQTVTLTNINTVSPLAIAAAPGGLTVTGANPADFVITADTCSGANLAIAATPAIPASSCTFTVTFTPQPITPTEVAVRTATVNIIPAAPNTAGIPNGLVALSGTAQYLTDVSAGANGAITPVGAALAKNAGAAVTFTVTPNAKFQVKDILVDGAVKPFTKPSNPTQPVNFVAPPLTGNQTINATFMPSGNLTGSGSLGVNDALKALKIAVGLQTPTAEDKIAMDVAPLAADGRPAGDGNQDLKDILLILHRVLGVVTW